MRHFLALLLAALFSFGIAHATDAELGVDEVELDPELLEQLETTEGQPIETLKQAVDALALNNDLLEVLLDKPELTDSDLAIMQRLTETIENALHKVDEEVDIMIEQVLEVRAGADGQEQERIRESGQDYLERIKTL